MASALRASCVNPSGGCDGSALFKFVARAPLQLHRARAAVRTYDV